MPMSRVYLHGVDDAKFRRQVVPGPAPARGHAARARTSLAKARAVAYVGDQIVAETNLLLAVMPDGVRIHPTAVVMKGAEIGAGTIIGPNAVVGEHVRLGRRAASARRRSSTASRRSATGPRSFRSRRSGSSRRTSSSRAKRPIWIGERNIFREFVTIHRGTKGGGGETTIGDRNVFMAYAHVAHDCHIGNDTIFGNNATLGGHVFVDDFATISAGSGVHQFCRIGRHAFIGGYSVVTKDALPYAKTVGNRARIYGLNTIGLMRRGFTPEVIGKLKRAYRYLLTSRLNTTRALNKIEQDATLACPEVQYLVDFIRNSQRGALLRRPTRRPRRWWRMSEGSPRIDDATTADRDASRPHRRQRAISVSRSRRGPRDGARRHRHRHQGRSVYRSRTTRPRRRARAIHWISLGELGKCITLLKTPARATR